MERYDAILIPGGGVRDGGELPEWSKRRFDMAMKYPHVQYYIPLSAGTFHKPPLLDAAGFPIYESIAGARYLMAAGVEESKILCETCSYDTIGNAYFARVIHVEPLMLKRILVITSAFHFPRTKEIFTWVFGLDHNSLGVELDFESVSDAGLDEEIIAARKKRESASLEKVKDLAQRMDTLQSLHRWLFSQHEAYRAGGRGVTGLSDISVESY